ncbi:MAG: sensor histidine kinase [Anaerostipes sp.]|jgi:signal transduction histidine kinase|nr:HAMP domain-containing sensor histidine kinase [Anaerostipes sp.]
MKIVNKVKIIFLPAIIVPIFLMVVSIAALSVGFIKTNSHALSDTGLERIMNPVKAMDKVTKGIFAKVKNLAVENPSKLEDIKCLEDMNSALKNKDSFILVRKGEKVYYRGSTQDEGTLEKKLPEFGSTASSQDSGMYLNDPGNYLLKQQDFKFSDGTRGSFFILTDMELLQPYYKSMISQIFFFIVGILVLTSFLLSWYMYSEFIRPLKKLKEGADRIKDGNLDDDVQIDSKDEIGELCQSFNAMRAELKESIEARIVYEKQNRDLISNISHDLKTPITAIKGYVEGIMDGVADTPEKMDRYIKTIYNKANDMDVLINELSLYSKIDSNIIPYNFRKIDINAYFKDCVDEIGADLEQKGMLFSYTNYCSANVMVMADPEQLKRVMNNIINNACKYSNKAKGRVGIVVKELERKIQVEIKDNGIGISKEDLPNIFRRTYRADMSRNSAGGSGLGLSICKKIIEEHDGEIWAESKVRAGTTIFFTLNKVIDTSKEDTHE